MAAHRIRKYKITLVVILTAMDAFAHPPRDVSPAAEILQGFKESANCITKNQRPSQWCTAFKALLQHRNRETAAFVLGANFGFSFTSESSAELTGARPGELRDVAACAALARLKYEDTKKRLNLTDARIIEILNIAPAKFAAWKARAVTNDSDQSVVSPHAGTEL